MDFFCYFGLCSWHTLQCSHMLVTWEFIPGQNDTFWAYLRFFSVPKWVLWIVLAFVDASLVEQVSLLWVSDHHVSVDTEPCVLVASHHWYIYLFMYLLIGTPVPIQAVKKLQRSVCTSRASSQSGRWISPMLFEFSRLGMYSRASRMYCMVTSGLECGGGHLGNQNEERYHARTNNSRL